MDSQKNEQQEERDKLHYVIEGLVPNSIRKSRNSKREWSYGYNKEFDIVIISKDGTLGEIYEIQNLRIGLPEKPKDIYSRSETLQSQYWEPFEFPEPLQKIKSSLHWGTKPREFKAKWIDYIEQEFDRREFGFWFMNNGEPTYITGSHYMYVQWAKIDVGLPDYRYANRISFLHWEACKADERSYGQVYLKIRRSGFSYMTSSEINNQATMIKESKFGILSKTGGDAKEMFVNKVVPILVGYPFFFKPIQDGMDKPKTEISFRVPASKITKNNMYDEDEKELEGLNTIVDWRNTGDNSYDGQKLKMIGYDEIGKWEKPNNMLKNWDVIRTCLRLGKRIIGKAMAGSTCNSQKTGGEEFKKLYYDSDVTNRNKNGQTKSGLYSLFIPMEFNMEGYIDMYGFPVLRAPEHPVKGIDGDLIEAGAIEFWENEVESKKGNSDSLNEFYRQFPRTESHAFRDESKNSLFNLAKIYQQIDYNDGQILDHIVTTGSFSWKDGVRDTKVIWTPNKNGRFNVTWIPKANMQNRVVIRNGIKFPGNDHIGAFGCDSYDISGTVSGGGSNGALHGLTGFHMDEAPVHHFFLEYIARPQTAEIFFEDMLMAIVFYGMPILVENNKPRLLYHLKNRGYRGFSMNRPDKEYSRLSKTERELGGIPNSSADILQDHAAAIESYIDKHVGEATNGEYRDIGEIGSMYFNRTLNDWSRFDITKRTNHDASISSGLAIMANQRHLYVSQKKEQKISIKFARYDNTGTFSKIIR